MLIRDKDLMTLSMLAEDGSRHAVDDILVMPGDLAVGAAVLDVGGWFDARKATVGIARFGTPNVEAGSWPARIAQADLEDGAKTGSLAHRGDAATDATARSLGDLLAGSPEIRADDGKVGHLMGMIFESDGWKLQYLVIETGGTAVLSENQRVVPASAVRRFDWTGGTVTLEGTVESVHQSPDLHEIDGVEGKWYNKVMAYYGLQS